MSTEKENNYVLVLEMPDDVDTAKLKESIEGRTIVIRAPRRPRRRHVIDRRYFHPDATPC